MKESEDKIQVDVVSYLYALRSKKFEFFATLNEAAMKGSSGKSKSYRMSLVSKLKKMGMKVGIMDIVFLCDGASVFLIELKTKTGRLSKSQKDKKALLESLGIKVFIARSVQDVKDILKEMEMI